MLGDCQELEGPPMVLIRPKIRPPRREPGPKASRQAIRGMGQDKLS